MFYGLELVSVTEIHIQTFNLNSCNINSMFVLNGWFVLRGSHMWQFSRPWGFPKMVQKSELCSLLVWVANVLTLGHRTHTRKMLHNFREIQQQAQVVRWLQNVSNVNSECNSSSKPEASLMQNRPSECMHWVLDCCNTDQLYVHTVPTM